MSNQQATDTAYHLPAEGTESTLWTWSSCERQAWAWSRSVHDSGQTRWTRSDVPVGGRWTVTWPELFTMGRSPVFRSEADAALWGRDQVRQR